MIHTLFFGADLFLYDTWAKWIYSRNVPSSGSKMSVLPLFGSHIVFAKSLGFQVLAQHVCAADARRTAVVECTVLLIRINWMSTGKKNGLTLLVLLQSRFGDQSSGTRLDCPQIETVVLKGLMDG